MLKRYSPDASANRAALDAAYADAMLAAARANPSNDTIALIAAKSAMDTRPWDYWTADKKPKSTHRGGGAASGRRVRRSRFTQSTPRPLSLHFHLMENGPDPKLAEAAADRLATPLSPTAGHLVHMPAHIYYRLGR